MKNKNKINIAKKIIQSESASLSGIVNKINVNFEKACDLILSCTGRVITIGIGKSGHIAAKTSATLSSTGTPSMFLHGSDCLHGDMGSIKKDDVVIFYSNSGETKELLLMLPLLRILKVKTICITGNKSSKLAKSSNIILDCGVRSEACPLNLTPTSSVIAAMSMSDALALTLLECRGFTSRDFARSHPQGSLGKRLLKKVSDVMITKNLPLVKKSSDLPNAVAVMSKYNYGIAIVIDENKKISGIFTDGDLRRVLQSYPNILNLKLLNVMTKKPIVVSENILAAEALNMMEEREITCLLVSSKSKKLDGLVTLNNILKAGIE